MRYGMGVWLDLDAPGLDLVGYDAGVSFSSRFDPETRFTATIISNTPEGAWSVARDPPQAARTLSRPLSSARGSSTG